MRNLVYDRRGPAAHPRACGSAARGDRAGRGSGRPRVDGRGNGGGRPPAVRQLGDGRLRAPCGGHAGDALRFGSGSLREVRRLAASSRARRWGSRRAASSPREPMPSSRSSMLSSMTTTIEVPEAVSPGASIRPAGGDLRRGEVVVEAGTRLGAPQVAALAAAGVAEARVSRRPRAAVLATGSELRRPGEPLEPGQIYEANGVLIDAQLASAGASVERLSTVADDEDAHRAALARGLEADVFVTSGGVSVGPHDLVRRIEAELGVEEVFWGVSVKPGKPISFGVFEGEACLRAAREPGLGARRLRALREAGRARAPGRGRSAAALRARAAGRRGRAEPWRVTSSSAVASSSTTRASWSSRFPGASRT